MTDAVREIVPDYMSALVAYRSWNVTPEGDLVSLNDSMPWPPKSKAIAVCTQIASKRREAWAGSQFWNREAWAGSQFWNQAYATTTAYVPTMATIRNKVQPSSFGDWWNRRRALKEIEGHHPPDKECSCGFYAAKQNGSRHFESYRSHARVWGEVYLWGKVQEYSEGYRAEYAYPKSLSTSSDLAHRIADRYGVPCGRVESGYDPRNDTINGIPRAQLVNFRMPTSFSGFSTQATWLQSASTTALNLAGEDEEYESTEASSTNAWASNKSLISRWLGI